MDYSQIINEELGGKRKEKKSSEASNYKKEGQTLSLNLRPTAWPASPVAKDATGVFRANA